MTIKKITLLILTITFSFAAMAQKKFSSFEKSQFIAGGDTLPYRIQFPKKFDPTQKYPVLLFLHGAGERGNDNEKQLANGGSWLASDSVRDNFPAIVIAPQCATADFWSNVKIEQSDSSRVFNFQTGGEPTKAMALVLGLMKNILDKPYVNKRQVYVGGLSMGGMGTLEILRREPKVFAAAFSICGGDHTANAAIYKRVPVWFFHGAKDDVVPPDHSKVMAEALKQQRDEVYLTIYPEANHNSWDSAFKEPLLLSWLFSKKR